MCSAAALEVFQSILQKLNERTLSMERRKRFNLLIT